MRIASSITSSEFRFNSGALALDLAATVRRRGSEPYDVLAEPGAAARWLREAGLTSVLLRLSSEEEGAVLALREAIWSAAAARSDRSRIPRSAITTINRAAAHPLAVPSLTVTGSRKLRTDDPFSAAISVIARDAIDLLSGTTRIKACAQPDCRMLFVDASPTGRRRWCSMDRCGSRAKGAVFRRRQERKHER